MAVHPALDEDFPTFNTHDFEYHGSDLLFLEEMGAWSDAYYTLLGPLLIAVIAMRSERTSNTSVISLFSFSTVITYFLISSQIQKQPVEELVFDTHQKQFIRQSIPLQHDDTTERNIIETIPYQDIIAVESLKCPIKKYVNGYETNLILKDQRRVNLFHSRDNTMGTPAEYIARALKVPRLKPECVID